MGIHDTLVQFIPKSVHPPTAHMKNELELEPVTKELITQKFTKLPIWN